MWYKWQICRQLKNWSDYFDSKKYKHSHFENSPNKYQMYN